MGFCLARNACAVQAVARHVKRTEKVPEIIETFSRIALLQGRNLQKKFLKTISFRRSNKYLFKEIIYGNEDYGFFKTTDFTHKKSKITLMLIPPGYKKPIYFYGIDKNNQKINLGIKRFKINIPAVFNRVKLKRMVFLFWREV